MTISIKLTRKELKKQKINNYLFLALMSRTHSSSLSACSLWLMPTATLFQDSLKALWELSKGDSLQ